MALPSTGDLARLPAGVTWNLRLSWQFINSQTTMDIHARVDNLFDQLVEDQIGLPNQGRIFSAGVSVGF